MYHVTAEASGEPWRGCVETLGSALSAEHMAGALHVVLSDHFLRYALVPWSENLVADAERLAFARLTLSEIYGSVASTRCAEHEQPKRSACAASRCRS